MYSAISYIDDCMPSSYTQEDLEECNKLCSDASIFSDDTGISNADKWQIVNKVFMCSEETGNLFSAVSFDDIFASDDVFICEAAGYIADLRSQFFEQRLQKYPNDFEYHHFYIMNKRWYGRFRERVSLDQLQSLLKTVKLV